MSIYFKKCASNSDYASNRVTVYEGDAKNSKDLEQALDKVDVVFASLSGSLDIEAQAIVDAMSKKDVKRLIFVVPWYLR